MSMKKWAHFSRKATFGNVVLCRCGTRFLIVGGCGPVTITSSRAASTAAR